MVKKQTTQTPEIAASKLEKAFTLHSNDVIKYPKATEKSVRLMQSENKLHFIVNKRSTKMDVKRAVEELFNVKVVSVNTYISPTQEKGAFIRLAPEYPAIEIATDLGLM